MSDTATEDAVSTIADYERFVLDRPEEERWELIDGVIQMMTNPTGNHGQITMNIAMPLKAAMDRRGCRTYAGSMRVQGSEDRARGDASSPDIVVHCGIDRNRTFVTDPLIVVEVLSRSTMDHDRGAKLVFFKRLAALRHIVLVYQDHMRVEHYRRGTEGWTVEILSSPSRRLALDAADVSIDLETIYADVPVLRPVETSDGPEDESPTPVP